MVLTTPLFESLKRHIPGCRITVLASKVNKDVISNNPFVDEVVLYQGIVKFMRGFRNKGIDLTIDPLYSYELKSAFLAFLSGAKYRIGFEESGREVFFNIKGPRPDPSKHMANQILSLLEPLAIKEDEAQPKIYLTPEEIDNAKKYII
jgi:ADP-heptose:LPS heptosyltransferase